MGRLIDADKFKEYIEDGILIAFLQAPLQAKKVEKLADGIIKDIDEQPTVEAIPKADYNAKLKADMVAALKELQLEIEEIETGGDAWELAIKVNCNAVIQKKIDALEYDPERGNDGNNVRQTD